VSAFAHKALLCSLYDQVVNAGQLNRIDEFIAPGFVGHFGADETPTRGPAEFAEVVVALRSAFPDINSAVSNGWLLYEHDAHVVGQGLSIDRLAAHVVFRGTQMSEFRGVDAGHGEMTWSEGVFARVEGDRIAELTTICGSPAPVRSPAVARAAG
jgi:predicted ester cyclase